MITIHASAAFLSLGPYGHRSITLDYTPKVKLQIKRDKSGGGGQAAVTLTTSCSSGGLRVLKLR